MMRRAYLGLLGAVGLATAAGCLGDNGSDGLYDTEDRESLLPDAVGPDWPDDDLERRDDLFSGFPRGWATSDEGVAVAMRASVLSIECQRRVRGG